MLFLLLNFILFLLLFICPIKCLIAFTFCLIAQLLFPAFFGYSFKKTAETLQSEQKKLGFSEVDLPEVPSQCYLAFLAGLQYLRYNFKSRYRLNRLHFSKTTAFLITCFKMPCDIIKNNSTAVLIFIIAFVIAGYTFIFTILYWISSNLFLNQLFLCWIPCFLFSSIAIAHLLCIIFSPKENKIANFTRSGIFLFMTILSGVIGLASLPPILGTKLLPHRLSQIFYYSNASMNFRSLVIFFSTMISFAYLLHLICIVEAFEKKLIKSYTDKIYKNNTTLFKELKDFFNNKVEKKDTSSNNKKNYTVIHLQNKEKTSKIENAKKPLNEMLEILNVKKIKSLFTFSKNTRIRSNIVLAKTLVMFWEEKVLIYSKIKKTLTSITEFSKDTIYIILEYIPATNIRVSLNNQRQLISIDTLFHTNNSSIDSITHIVIISKENDEEKEEKKSPLPLKLSTPITHNTSL